ncbi:MAG TPA: sensor domain-containing diguanylate cyclase [Nitrospirota bacterium]
MSTVKILNEEVRELIDLLEVAKLVVSTLDIDQVLDAILKSAMKLTSTSAGSIALYDKATNELEMRAHSGFSRDFVGNARWKVRKGGLTDKILKTNKPTVITNTTNKKFFTNAVAIKEGIKSMVCVPLVLDKEIIGVFYVDDFNPREFTERELRLLYILSSFASMSIRHAREHDTTVKLAITDGLTGLFNHRHFQEVLEREISRTLRYNDRFSLIIIDIDNFKQVNDKYGHQFGDQVLRKLSEILLSSCRDSDTVARYGGEEFAVILPKVDSSQATLTAQRIKKDIKARSAELMDGKMPLTVSIGIATCPADDKSRQGLIEKADKALYTAKARGKDRAVEFRNLKRTEVA